MKKNKAVAVSLTAVVAVTGLLAGTYAWQSISQRALNQVREVGNPGGRLHDDFNFLKDGNKDVYVENFTDPDDATSQPIYARIRLDEYMEIGPNAGITGRDEHEIEVIGSSTAKLEDMNTWTTYLWDRESKIEAGTTVDLDDETSEFRKYILWNQDGNGNYKTNGVTNYMPTFNKNKDSNDSQINGTLEGVNGIPYGDHVSYLYDAANLIDPDKTSIETNFAVYDADTDDLDELTTSNATVKTILAQLTDSTGDDWDTTKLLNSGTPLTQLTVAGTQYEIHVTTDNDTNPTKVECVEVNLDGTTDGDYAIRIVKETHTAAQTLAGGEIISMAKWLSPTGKNKQPGNYWVYDEDGWVYWANPIEPSKVTSLLLDKIELRSDAKLKDEYYYAINVVAQFASKGQWGDCTTATTVTTDNSGNVTVTTGDGTGFYATENGGMTAAATELLSVASELPYEKYTVTITSDGVNGKSTSVKQEETITFKAATEETIKGKAAPEITWTVENENGESLSKGTAFSTETGIETTLTVGVEPEGTTLIVKATYIDENKDYGIGTFEVKVTEGTQVKAFRSQIEAVAENVVNGSFDKTNVVTIDNQDWYVLATQTVQDSEGNEQKQALLYAASALDYDGTQTYKWVYGFGGNGQWIHSNIRAYLNSMKNNPYDKNFKNTYKYSAALAELTVIKTRTSVDSTTGTSADFTSTDDKVFLLSEADLYGSFLGKFDGENYEKNETQADDYLVKETSGKGVQLMKTDGQRQDLNEQWTWLRSPITADGSVALVGKIGNLGTIGCVGTNGALRPAFWVDISSVEPSE